MIADAVFAKNGVTGAQVSILNDGNTVWTHAYGHRDKDRLLPMRTDTNIWAASITKSVFATWVMLQAQRGTLNLDQPVASMLPRPLTSFPAYASSGSEIVEGANWGLITPRILLSHTSGLANFAASGEPDGKLRLHFRPGSRFAYSGEGLNLLQFAIEQKSGEPLDVAMQRDLFRPLGMSRTGMVWSESFAGNTALRYDARGGLIGATHRDHARGAGSMATTVEDLDRFLEALLAGEIVSKETFAAMMQPQIRIRSKQQFPTFLAASSDEGPRVGLAYGTGWGLLTKTRFGPAFFKEGHGDGAENYLICFVRHKDCMVLLTNSDNGELAFQPLLERLLGDTVTPWTWESYTRDSILNNEEHRAAHR